MSFTTRSGKGSALSHTEMDANWNEAASTGSNSYTGTQQISGSGYYISGSTSVLQAIGITGSIVPQGNGVWDLGSPIKQFRHLFVSGGTIFLGGTPLSKTDLDTLRSGKSINATDTRYIEFERATHWPNPTWAAKDADTYIQFGVDQFYVVAGGVTLLDVDQDEGYVKIGSSGYVVTSSDDLYVSGNLDVTGDAIIRGHLTFGDADTDNISFGAEVSSSIIPTTDGTYNLGSQAKTWKTIYADEYIGGGNDPFVRLVLGGTNRFKGNLSASGNFTLEQPDFYVRTGAGPTLRMSLGATNIFNGQLSASNGVYLKELLNTPSTPSTKNGVLFASSSDNLIYWKTDGGVVYNLTTATGSGTGIASVAADATPQLGGNLDLNAKTISGSGELNFAGGIHASGSIVATGSITALGNISSAGSLVIKTSQTGSMSVATASYAVSCSYLAEADTLDSVTDRGNVTANSIQVGLIKTDTYRNSGNTTLMQASASGDVTFQRAVSVLGRFTSSQTILGEGDISASGDVYGTTVYGSQVELLNINLSNIAPSASSAISGSWTATRLPSGTVSSSAQLPSGILSSSAQLPVNVVSSSAQLASDISGSWTAVSTSIATDIDTLLSGQATKMNSSLNNITAAGRAKISGSWENGMTVNGNLRATGIVSASQVSASQVIVNSQIGGNPAGNFVNIGGLGRITSTGYISSSTGLFTDGAVSASTAVYVNSTELAKVDLSNLDFSGSAVISGSWTIARLPSGTVSSSAQLPASIISSSAQIATDISGSWQNGFSVTGNVIASGIVSASAISASLVTVNTQVGGDVAGNFVIIGGLGRVISSGYVSSSTGLFTDGDISASRVHSEVAVYTNGTELAKVDLTNLSAAGRSAITGSWRFGQGVLSGSTQGEMTMSEGITVYNNLRMSGSDPLSVIFENLPTSRPSTTGSMWLSGSAGQGSKYLVVTV